MIPDPKSPGHPQDQGNPAPSPFTHPLVGTIRVTSPLGTDPSAHELLCALGRLARDTRRALRIALLDRGRRLPSAVEPYLEGTLNHLTQIREGFALALRTDECRSQSEMEDLVREILVDWNSLERLGVRWIPACAAGLEQPVTQLLAFAHARVVMGALPRVPPELVTFPAWSRSYADIPVPRSPGDVLGRIDELERVISVALQAASGGGGHAEPVQRLGRDRLRRAYGYFETSAWLVEQVCG